MAAAHWTSFLSAILCRSLWQTHTDICICTSWEWNTPRSPLTSTQKLSRAPRLSFCLPEGNIQSRWGLESKQHRVSCRDNKAGDKMRIIVWPAFISPHINFWIHEEEKPRVSCFTSGCWGSTQQNRSSCLPQLTEVQTVCRDHLTPSHSTLL